MATPMDVELIKSGIDTVLKIQTEKGKIVNGRIAPQIDHREGYYTVQVNSGFKDARIYGPGESIEPDRKEKIHRQDYYPFIFAKAWITYEWSSDEDVYNQMASNVNDAALAMLRRRNKEEMNLLNNGFDTNFAGPDGQPLFSTAHTGATGVAVRSNRSASGSSLDVGLLETMLAAYAGGLDVNGESLFISGDVDVWTGTPLHPLLYRLVNAELQPGGPDNDPNYVGTKVRAQCGHQISGSGVYMLSSDSDDHKLRTIQFSPYQMGNPKQGDALDIKHTVFERYRAIFETFEYTYADPGP